MRRFHCTYYWMIAFSLCVRSLSFAQSATRMDTTYLLQPARVFDGLALHHDWVVLIRGNKIAAVGTASQVKPPAETIAMELPGRWLERTNAGPRSAIRL